MMQLFNLLYATSIVVQAHQSTQQISTRSSSDIHIPREVSVKLFRRGSKRLLDSRPTSSDSRSHKRPRMGVRSSSAPDLSMPMERHRSPSPKDSGGRSKTQSTGGKPAAFQLTSKDLKHETSSSDWKVASGSSSHDSYSMSLDSSPGTSPQRANPTSAFGTTTGPANIKVTVGRTRPEEPIEFHVPAGQTKTWFGSHVKNTEVQAEHLNGAAKTTAFTRGWQSGVSITADRGVGPDAAMLVEPSRSDKNWYSQRSNAISKDVASRRTDKPTGYMASLSGTGQLDAYAANYGHERFS